MARRRAWGRADPLGGESGQVLFIVAIVLPVLFFFFALALDFGRVQVVRSALQGAADAGALAGALSAEVRQEWRRVWFPVIDPVTGKVTGWDYYDELVREWAEITDPEQAETAARLAVTRNGAPPGVEIDWPGCTWEVYRGDQYRVVLRARVRTVLAGALMAGYGGREDLFTLPLRVEATAKSRLAPP